MLALKVEEHLASPVVPGQTCAARRHQINVLQFQIELKDHKLLRKVMGTFWYCIQVKIL
jgi:hypothetical protein